MLALTLQTETAEGLVLLDPLTGRRYGLDEAELPESLKEFLLGMTGEAPREEPRPE